MYLEESRCDMRNWIIGGGYVALTACMYVGAATSKEYYDKTVANASACCSQLLGSITPACQGVVESAFGKGLAVSNITSLCKDTFPALKATASTYLTLSGSAATVLTLGGLFYLGKKVYDWRKAHRYYPVFNSEAPSDT